MAAKKAGKKKTTHRRAGLLSREDVRDAVKDVIRNETLKEELWKNAVKEGMETAMWDISGYWIISVLLLIVTGIVLAAGVFGAMGYALLRTLPLP